MLHEELDPVLVAELSQRHCGNPTVFTGAGVIKNNCLQPLREALTPPTKSGDIRFNRFDVCRALRARGILDRPVELPFSRGAA
jgi:hypothetical protein